MLTVLELANEDTRLHKESRNEQAGPCPDNDCRCQHDGFRVKWNGKQWVFMCRGCWDSEEVLTAETARAIGKLHRVGEKRGWGDAIDYARHYRKTEDGKPFSFKAAKALVVGDSTEAVPSSREQGPPDDAYDYQSEDWQQRVTEAVKRWKARLWSESGSQVLEYARSRGLSDEMIRRADLGCSVIGGRFYLTIPSINDGRYVNVYRRAIEHVPHNERWRDIDGSCKDELYLADSLRRRELPTVLVESPICALIILQEYGREHINAVATGGVKGAQSVRTLGRLARVQDVLGAFDADQEGDEGAMYWTKRLKNAQRLRPLLKDVGDMLLDGWDIQAWVDQALYPEVEEVELGAEIIDVCSKCGREVERYDDNGKAYCGLHYPYQTGEERQQWGIGQMAAITGGQPQIFSNEEVIAFKARRLQELRDAFLSRVPALPQQPPVTICQHSQPRIKHIKKDEYLVRAPCKLPALLGSIFCTNHQYAQEILKMGESCHYREVKISEAVTILSGRHNWEAYAELARADILPTIERAVKRVSGL